MKIMKIGKNILLLFFVGMLAFVPSLFLFAGPETPPEGTFTDISSFWTIMETLRNWLFGFLLILVVIFLLLAAYHFITASGSEDKVNKGRDMVKYAIIGIAVMLLAGGAYALVSSFFTEFGAV